MNRGHEGQSSEPHATTRLPSLLRETREELESRLRLVNVALVRRRPDFEGEVRLVDNDGDCLYIEVTHMFSIPPIPSCMSSLYTYMRSHLRPGS
jgi:hypothetical protein